MPHGSSVATRAAISLLDDTTLQDKTPKLCPESGDFYYLDKTSTETVDNELVLATNSGTGRWHKTGTTGLFIVQEGPPNGFDIYPKGTVIIDTYNSQILYYLGYSEDGESVWFAIYGVTQTYTL